MMGCCCTSKDIGLSFIMTYLNIWSKKTLSLMICIITQPASLSEWENLLVDLLPCGFEHKL